MNAEQTLRMNNKYLLDASAILALLQKESGSEMVAQCIPCSAISSVNLAEVAKERGFNNTRKYGAGFWLHRRARKAGA